MELKLKQQWNRLYWYAHIQGGWFRNGSIQCIVVTYFATLWLTPLCYINVSFLVPLNFLSQSSCMIWDFKRQKLVAKLHLQCCVENCICNVVFNVSSFAYIWGQALQLCSECVCERNWSVVECQKATRALFRPFVWLFCSLAYGRSSGILLCWLSLLKCQRVDWGAVSIIVNREHDGLSQLHYDAQTTWVDAHRLQHLITSCMLLSHWI